MMSVHMADNAAHLLQLRRHLLKLAVTIDLQLVKLAVLPYADLCAIHQEPWIGAVGKVLRQAVDRHLVFVWLTLPRTELGAVAAFVAVSVQVQGLETILEARNGNGYVGAVRANVDAFAAHVVTFQAALGLLSHEGFALGFIHQRY